MVFPRVLTHVWEGLTISKSDVILMVPASTFEVALPSKEHDQRTWNANIGQEPHKNNELWALSQGSAFPRVSQSV